MPEPISEMAADGRPSSIPPAARWFYDAQEWLLCQRDEQGELHGPLRSFRADGTRWLEFEYRHGKRHGPFRRFHASGAIEQEGRYFDDLADGLLCVYANGEQTRTIRECCIPDGTRVMRQEHRRGQLLAESYHAADGRRLFDPNAAASPSDWPKPLREREDDVLSGVYDFWSSREPLIVADPDAARVEQPLGALREAIDRAAQRVEAHRAVLMARGEQRIPPHVSRLISGAPLRRFSFKSEDGETVHVDETLALNDRPTPELVRRTRIEWTALCWLCWAAGLDRVAVPTQIVPRPELFAALVVSSERQAALSGHDLRPDGDAHFHSLNEMHLPASALAHLADHYREMRAVLLFVSDPECQSPWQDDLGRA